MVIEVLQLTFVILSILKVVIEIGSKVRNWLIIRKEIRDCVRNIS